MKKTLLFLYCLVSINIVAQSVVVPNDTRLPSWIWLYPVDPSLDAAVITNALDVGTPSFGVDQTNMATLTDHGSFSWAVATEGAAHNILPTEGTITFFAGVNPVALLETVTNTSASSNRVNGRFHAIKNVTTTNIFNVGLSNINNTIDRSNQIVSLYGGQSKIFQADTNYSTWQTIAGTTGMQQSAPLISGVPVTNTTGSILCYDFTTTETTAAVSGAAVMAFVRTSSAGNRTNYNSVPTTATNAVLTWTNHISMWIPPNGILTPTNLSTGAGNSSALLTGDVISLP